MCYIWNSSGFVQLVSEYTWWKVKSKNGFRLKPSVIWRSLYKLKFNQVLTTNDTNTLHYFNRNTRFRRDHDKNASNLYPDELFTLEQKRDGAIVLYIFCLVYMFFGLAIVCDDFFVPALEVWGRLFSFDCIRKCAFQNN